MSSNIMKVYYGVDRLPYKDSARSVHYPIVGQEFKGASDITEIRFYVDRIGGTENTLWVANTKLPNGKIGYKKLEATRDSEIGEYYVSLSLSQFYTQYKGDVYISLNGYQGGVTLEQDEDDNYVIVGNPIMSATGSIKLTVAYSVQPLPSDIYEYISLDDILAYISGLPTQEFIQNRAVPRVQITNTQYNNTPIADIISEYGFIATEFEPYTFVLEIKGVSNYRTYLIDIVGASSLTPEQAKVKVIDLVRVRDGVTSATFDISTNTFKDLITGLTFNTYVKQTNNSNKVYATDNSGNQTTLNYGTSGLFSPNLLVQRTNLSQIKVPLTPSASDDATSKGYVDTFGYSISMSLDSSTYVLTLLLKDKNNNTLSTQTIDLPLESVVVSGEYDSDTQSIILTLQNGNTITIPVGDLVNGLATTTDLQNGLATKQDTLTFDTTPTQGSTNPVTSGGIKSYVDSHGGGTIPEYTVSSGKVQDFITNEQVLNKLIILHYSQETLLGMFKNAQSPQGYTEFEFEDMGNEIRYYGKIELTSETTFGNLFGPPYIKRYELRDNKVSSISASSTNTEYPSAKCVYDQIKLLHEILDGKCGKYVLSYGETLSTIKSALQNGKTIYDQNGNNITTAFLNGDYDSYLDGSDSDYTYANPLFNSQNARLDISGEYVVYVFYIVQDTLYDVTDAQFLLMVEHIDADMFCKIGDLFYVVETDVPDRWAIAKSEFAILETTKVDLTNYYTKAQSDNKYALLSTLAPTYDNTATYSVGDKCVYGGKLFICTTAITQAEDFDNTHWREMTIAGDFATKDEAFNVINASDIVSDTLTQAQVNVIANGKPTRISGTLLSLNNPILETCVYLSGANSYFGIIKGANAIGVYSRVQYYEIYPITDGYKIQIYSNPRIEIRNVADINGKTVPAYPSNTGTFVLKCVNGVLTWVQE